MKKKTLSKSMHWLKDAGLKALVVLLLVMAGFYTYAQITWPAADPNDVSGIVGKFVGESDGGFNAIMDYETANSKCSASTDINVVGSHVCTPDEMLNSYNHGVPGVSPVYTYVTEDLLWVNVGPPGYLANANDCQGWTRTSTSSADPNYGAVWEFASKAGFLTGCRNDMKFACCK